MGNFGFGEIVFVILMGITIGLIPTIFFLLTLQNTLREVRPENRKMDPGMVWLILIPLFGIVWQFIVVNNIGDSLRDEFKSRGIEPGEERPGTGIGLAYCILACCGIIPFLGILASIASLVCWIIYWVKISDFKNMLVSSGGRV
jgi:hypothetical protein